MQKSVIFVKKNLRINMRRIKNIVKLEIIVIVTSIEYRGDTPSIYNLKYSVPKKIPTASYNGFTYDYDFIIKDLTEEFKKQFTCFNFLTYYNLLIVQDLWQASDKILSIIFLKEFIELNVITDMIIKNMRLVELNISIVTVFLNTQILKMI